MSDTSARLGLPFIAPSQAQKHVTHNEALQRLDALTLLTLEEVDATVPPAAPEQGALYALGARPRRPGGFPNRLLSIRMAPFSCLSDPGRAGDP